jgi:hypothetical protein
VEYVVEKMKGVEDVVEYLRLYPDCRRYEFTAKLKELQPARGRVRA